VRIRDGRMGCLNPGIRGRDFGLRRTYPIFRLKDARVLQLLLALVVNLMSPFLARCCRFRLFHQRAEIVVANRTSRSPA
jgi:hypothetical protein